MTKILKIYENNQYRNAMTKPLSTDSFKKMKKKFSTREFDLIIQGILEKNKIGHLFVVDIESGHKNADEKQLFLNEIFTPIFQKKKFFLQTKGLFSNFQMQ